MKQLWVRLAVAVTLLLPALQVLTHPWPVLIPLAQATALFAYTLSPALIIWLSSWSPEQPLTIRTLAVSLLTSLALTALLLWLHREIGLNAEAALLALAAEYLLAGLLCYSLLRQAEVEWEAADGWLLLTAGVFVLLTWLQAAGSYRLMLGDFGLWNMASAQEALRQVPPENPVFAGTPTYLYWGYDLFIGEIGQAMGRTAGEAGFWLNIMALGALVYVGYEFGRLFFMRRFWRWFTTIVCVGGLNGLGFGWLLVRIVGGRAPLSEYIFGTRLDALALKYNWNNCAYAQQGFSEIGDTGLGMALFAVAVVASLQALREGQAAWRGLVVAVCLAGSLLLPISGGMTAAFVIMALFIWLLAARQQEGFRQRALALAVPVVAGLVLGLIHLHELRSVFVQHTVSLAALSVETVGQRIWDLCGPWLWALPFVPLGFIALMRRRTPEAYLMVSGTILLIVCAVLIVVSQNDQHKFVVLLSPCLAVVVTTGIERLQRQWFRRLLAGIVITLLSLTLLTTTVVRFQSKHYRDLFHYQPRAKVLEANDALSPNLRQAYDFIATATPVDSVIVVCPRGLQQSTELLEIPLLAHRQVWTGRCDHWMSGGYGDCPAREQIALKLYHGEVLTPAQWDSLHALARPVYLLLRQSHPEYRPAAERLAAVQPKRFIRVWHQPGLSLYKLKVSLPPNR